MRLHARITFAAVVFLVVLPLQSSATTAADFLNIGVSVRQYSLAEAGLALDNGVASAYSNPAGLAKLDRPGASFMHNLWYQDIAYDYLGAATPIGSRGTIAMSAAYLHMGNIPAYNEFDQPIGSYSPYSMAGIISYGMIINEYLSLGLSGKYITEKIADINSSGIAADLGAEVDFGKIVVGASITNLGPRMKYSEQKFELPASAIFSVAYKPFILPASLIAGVKAPFAGEAVASAGIEYQAAEFLSLRSGYSASSAAPSEKAFNLGLGLTFMGGTFDYAYRPGKYFDATHAFSITFSFGRPRQAYFGKLHNSAMEFKETPPIAASKEAKPVLAEPVIPAPIIDKPNVEAKTENKPDTSYRAEKLETPNKQHLIESKPIYVVSAGKFKDISGARAQMDMLARIGFDAFSEAQSDGLIRVWLIKTDNKKKAEKLLKKATASGLSCRMEIE